MATKTVKVGGKSQKVVEIRILIPHVCKQLGIHHGEAGDVVSVFPDDAEAAIALNAAEEV